MPPVRWKSWIYVMAIYVQTAFVVTAAQQMQDSISMSSDGWRPIVGTRRQPAPNESGPERTHYPNQNQAFDVIPAEVLNIEATTLPYIQKSTSPQKNAAFIEKKQGIKLKHKASSHHFVSTGQRQSSFPQQYKKTVKKPVMVQNKPRKPTRGQALAHSTRNEVFMPPPLPPNTGSFSIVKSVTPNNIKIREAQGFGLIGNNYAISQQNAHIELARFPLTGESILQRPTFFLAKPLQNDEFTRNLVPPPPRSRVQQKAKGDTKISLYAFKEGPATDATSNVPQFGARPNQFLPQVSPTFEFSNQQQIPKSQQNKEQAVDVQVTKENLKHFSQNGAPSPALSAPVSFGNTRNNFPIGFVEYNFQKRGPQNSPSPITYEVTEGKYIDTPSQQYQFRPQDGFFQFQNLRQPPAPPNARPGVLFQEEVSTQSPPIFEAPLVDLSVPPFLPTPYKPENGVIPTSPTQSEAATVFTQVSNKMNRYRNNALKDNPLFFNIKEVSTHYPVLGAPEAQSEGGTDIPFSLNENGEISNDITTTQRERTRRPTKEPTRPTSTRDPTKARITNRRRPRPKKPSTTTTEEPVVEIYESQKSQETIEEVPVETEKPPRRRRPKPTAYRTQQETHSGVRGPTENKHMYEDSSGRQRGRNRYKNRERPSTERIDTNVIKRKRLRPSYTENAIREQPKHSFEEATGVSVEQEQYSYERDSSADQSYSQETQHSDEAGAHQIAQGQSFETEIPERHFEPTQDLPLQQQSRPFIEEIHPATEKVEDFERTRAAISSSTEQDFSTHFHIPENEIDYTTQPHPIQDESSEEFSTSTITTTTTTQPTATVETSSTKSTRIRRPTKYDSSNRPRFSVKDYKQRLTQYTSTTPSSTTQAKNISDNMRLRFPNRIRTRPSPTSSSGRLEEVISEEPTTTARSRFKPKDPRHQATTESDLIITEKAVKAVNTRLRPFGRSTKPTVESTTAAPKISIRPNLFSARRRAGYPSLKSRIQNKLKKNETEENDVESTTLSQNEIEDVDPLNAAESATTEVSSTTTDFSVVSPTSQETSTGFTENSVTTDDNIMKNEDFMYSQRVSDLTSSFKDYDKPGVFNSVAPTSRSIPNHFTISTDDPILPIEAFFPNLKEKDRAKER